MKRDYEYIIVGGGIAGLALARILTDAGKDLLVLEKGAHIHKYGSVFRSAPFYDKYAFARTLQGNILLRGIGVGATSLTICGNAVRPSPEECERFLGIDLSHELSEVEKECRVRTDYFPIGKASRKIMDASNQLGYTMRPMPKFCGIKPCVSCGNCILGCIHGAKWSALEYLDSRDKKINVLPHFSVTDIIQSQGKAIGVRGKRWSFSGKQSFFAEKTILCAGGVGTPIILQNSGLDAGENFFLDFFNVVYGFKSNLDQTKEVCMTTVCDIFHEDKGFLLSPFVDIKPGFFAVAPKNNLGAVLQLNDALGIMVKITDDNKGRVLPDGKIDKTPTESDYEKLNAGVQVAKEILLKCGINQKKVVVTNPRGAHPGGGAAIGKVVDENLQTQIKNLYVCDSSVFREAPGMPPILSLLSLVKWFSNKLIRCG